MGHFSVAEISLFLFCLVVRVELRQPCNSELLPFVARSRCVQITCAHVRARLYMWRERCVHVARTITLWHIMCVQIYPSHQQFI